MSSSNNTNKETPATKKAVHHTQKFKSKKSGVLGGTVVKMQVGDVLLGRGSGISRHPGNIRFRLLVKLYKEEYTKTVRIEKMNVAEKIVSELRTMQPPGRFLEQHGSAKAKASIKYICVHEKVAVEKTAQALRERKWSPFSRSEAYATLKTLNLKLMEQLPSAVKKPTVPKPLNYYQSKPKKQLAVKKGATNAKKSLKSKLDQTTSGKSTKSAAAFPQHALMMKPKSKATATKVSPGPHTKQNVSEDGTPTKRCKFWRLERIVNDALQEEFDLYLATLLPKLYDTYYETYFGTPKTPTPTVNTVTPPSTSASSSNAFLNEENLEEAYYCISL